MNEQDKSLSLVPPDFMVDEAGDDPLIMKAISLLVNDENIDEISDTLLQQHVIDFLRDRGILKPVWKVDRDQLNKQFPF